jgi:hypothetical protein
MMRRSERLAAIDAAQAEDREKARERASFGISPYCGPRRERRG